MSWYHQAPQVTGPHFIASKNPHAMASYTSNGKGGFVVIESTTIPVGAVFGNASIHYGTDQHPQAFEVTTTGKHLVPPNAPGNLIRALISTNSRYTNVKISYFQYV